MKRIAVFIDGTWDRADDPHPTNVARLAAAARPGGRGQVVLYFAGLGTGRGDTRLARARDRWLGGLFGAGLDRQVADAWRAVARAYAPGDALHLFGFSRGATAARSLAGLIRCCGVPRRDALDRVPDLMDEALAIYRRRDPEAGPDDAAARAFRARRAHPMAVSECEARERGLPRMRIAYLGVWDTVGALGVPRGWPLGDRLNARYRFHDLALSSTVAAARHALAVDERRGNFAHTPWTNLDALRARVDPEAYQQRWFPGDHGSVGGGGDVTALSAGALVWIAEGAARAGLSFDGAALGRAAADADPLGPLRSTSARPGLLARLTAGGVVDRPGPTRAADVSPEARRRWRHHGAAPGTDPWPYRPATLRPLAADLNRPGPRGT